jgi:hypothetical protein
MPITKYLKLENIMTKTEKAAIPFSHVHNLISKSNGQKYRISVATPYFFPNEYEEKFPVIYLLDSDVYFGMVTEMTRIMSVYGFQPMIIVGIGYQPFESPFEDLSNWRARDMSPVDDKKWSQSAKEQGLKYKLGGADKFLSFIHDELIPFIESRYQTIPENRTLVGHSFGGIFTLYSLFKKPDIFQRYLAGSFPLKFGDEVILSMEENYAKTQKSLPVRLFIGSGSLEYGGSNIVSDMFRFTAILENRNYKDLKFSVKVFEDYNHTEVIAPFIQAGLKSVFS